MSEKIRYIALFTSLIGLFVLTFASVSISPPKASIADISQVDAGKKMMVEGVVEDVHVFDGGSAILSINDGSGTIQAYLPYQVSQRLDANNLNGSKTKLTGTVGVYKGRLELVVRNIDGFEVVE